MVKVTIDGGALVVRMEGLDKLWTFKSRITVPLTNVRGATRDPGIVRQRKGLRAPGTQVPGLFTAGTFHRDGGRDFWDVRDPAGAVVIQLDGDRYDRLVLEVEDPAATVDLIENAITR